MTSLRNKAAGIRPGSIRAELCWFGATAFAVTGYLLVLVAVDVSTGTGWSRRGFTFVALAAVALALTAVLTRLGFRAERRQRRGARATASRERTGVVECGQAGPDDI